MGVAGVANIDGAVEDAGAGAGTTGDAFTTVGGATEFTNPVFDTLT